MGHKRRNMMSRMRGGGGRVVRGGRRGRYMNLKEEKVEEK